MLSRHFTQNHKCGPHGVAAGKMKRSPKFLGHITWKLQMSVQNFMAINAVAVELYADQNSGPTGRSQNISPTD